MKRAFFSLYFVVVLALLAAGWGLDRLWYQLAEPEREDSLLAQIILQSAADDPSLNTTHQLLRTLNASGLVRADLLPSDQVTGERLLERLRGGDPVLLSEPGQNPFLYQQLPGHAYILMLERRQLTQERPWLRPLLTLVFYAAIALAIFFWLWPLSRDLATLEQHAQALGLDNRYEPVALPNHATAYRLGDAFNRMTERIRELIDTQRELTHAVSHELRTPLARMKFALEMAEAQEPSLRLEGLKADVAEMDQLVNQLLSYARLEQSLPTLMQTPGDMRSMVEAIGQRLLTGQAEPKQLSIHPDRANLLFECDWPLMERAVLNLVQNALRFARTQVRVTLEANPQGYRIVVDDDGPGIPPEARERVFESFTRLRDTSGKQSAGFGLGLAIVRRVSRWHRGSARAETSPEGGARFVLEWPKTATTRT